MPRQTVQTTIKEWGVHYWVDAPDEVAFLRNSHRHMFHITAEVAVDHSNRDVEFFILQSHMRDWALELTPMRRRNSGGSFMSCEMMAEQIADRLNGDGYNVLMVEVSEDGESAGRWYRD